MKHIAGPTNDQILVGASHNVFAGKVVKQIGNKETEIGPHTILDQADVANHNTRNAFRDLPEEAKATARARAEEARAAMEKDKAQ